MKFRTCLPSRSPFTPISGDSPTPSPPTKSEILNPGCGIYSSSSSSSTTISSLQSSLSLLTLPSVPSLQKVTLSPQNDASQIPATAVLLTRLSPTRPTHVNSLSVHGNLLYAASGGAVFVHRISRDVPLGAFGETAGSVKSVAFSGGKIFTGHQDCKIRVWKLDEDRKQHVLIATLPTVEDRLRRSFLPKNYVQTRRHKKKLWNQHYDVVSGLASCRDGSQDIVLSISWDKSMKIWRARDFRCLGSINKAHDDAINCVTVSKDGLTIYTGSADRRIKAWKKEGKTYGLIATLEKHKSAVNALALSVDGSILFSGSCDRSILVWEKENSSSHMAVTGALRGHAGPVLCLIVVRDLLLSGSGDRKVRIWRRGADGRFGCLAVLDGHGAPVRSLAAAEEEEEASGGGVVRVFSGSFDGEIRVWQVEVASGKRLYLDPLINLI